MFGQRKLIVIVGCIGLCAMPFVHAAHPLISEDTGTQGSGNAELELGSASIRDNGDGYFSFQPQLSYGLSPMLDLILQPAWLADNTRAAGRERGFGDTNIDAKWRFYGDAPISFALRAGLALPSSEGDLGLPHGEVSAHAVFVTTIDLAPFTVHGNLGYTRNPDMPGWRVDVYHASAAVQFAASESLSLEIDTSADSNPDPTQRAWPAVALAGAIYTIKPGLDIDIGYKTRLNRAAPAKQYLFGLTYRWAP